MKSSGDDAQAIQAEPGSLEGVIGVLQTAEHPIRHGAQARPIRLELVSQCAGVVHVSHSPQRRCDTSRSARVARCDKGVSVTAELRVVLYPVKDVEKAKATFVALLGVEPHVDSPYYVGFSVDGSEIGLLPNGHDHGMSGPEPFYDVDDLEARLVALTAVGAAIVQSPTEVGGGMRVAKVRDTEGNVIGLRQPPVGA
jgi:predicted enzyme related to lactoylglutathione lyase